MIGLPNCSHNCTIGACVVIRIAKLLCCPVSQEGQLLWAGTSHVVALCLSVFMIRLASTADTG